jgi:hypothetical protein
MLTDTVWRYKITDDFRKVNIIIVACATFFQPGKQAHLFGGDRGRQAPLMLHKPWQPRVDLAYTFMETLSHYFHWLFLLYPQLYLIFNYIFLGISVAVVGLTVYTHTHTCTHTHTI